MHKSPPKFALLALATGDIFFGDNIGSDSNLVGGPIGEVVFNTAMTGYQEILTDPSYAQQLITLTHPHIGNTGMTSIDNESEQVFAKGLIVRDCVSKPSSWRNELSLPDFLIKHNIVGISNIDTRALTKLLRDKGALGGCIVSLNQADIHQGEVKQAVIDQAVEQAKQFTGLAGMDLAKEVSTQKIYPFSQGTYSIENNQFSELSPKYKVAVYDFGVKKNILRLLVDAGCKLTVYPAQTPVETVLADKPDGVFLSNGPGDPQPCDYAILAIKTLLDKKVPMFGICLGHQLLALASGASTQKMKFGHHGANHPVQDLDSKQVLITSQNHGFTVNKDDLGGELTVTHLSLFDQSIQGIKVNNRPAFGFQGHPEASPGPHEAQHLFTQFSALMERSYD